VRKEKIEDELDKRKDIEPKIPTNEREIKYQQAKERLRELREK
jgi:hypothetical protein